MNAIRMNDSMPLGYARRYWPHALLLLACAAVGAAAQYCQPDLGLLDGLGLPKWAECVAGISFLVLLVCGLAQRVILPVLTAGMVLLSHPLSATVRARLPSDEAFQQASAQVNEYVLVHLTLFTALVPLSLALLLLSRQMTRKRADAEPHI